MKCRKCGINETTKGQRWCSSCRNEDTSLREKWIRMFRRCYDPKHNRYATHGAIGIEVCDEWDNFEVFHKWCLDNRWVKGLHLDRIDNDGNYEPDNCQFLTREEHFAKTAHERISKWVRIKHKQKTSKP